MTAGCPEVVTAAAECGWIDQIMIQYNYRTMGADDVRRAWMQRPRPTSGSWP